MATPATLINLIFFTILCGTQLHAQNDTSITYDNINYSCFIVKVDTSNLSNFFLSQNQNNLNHKDFIEDYIANHDSNFYAINACINDKDGHPLGLFINRDQEKMHLNLEDGIGNFYLKPNGVLCITKSDVVIVSSQNFTKPDDIILAVQSGPMLLINDTIHPSFNATSTNKNLRCGVGIATNKKNKYVVFSISNEPVTLSKFATMFKEYFHCKNALCIESANSSIYSPKSNGNLATNKVIGNYIIFDLNGNNTNIGSSRSNVIQMSKSPSGIYELPVELNGVLRISFIFDPGASDISISPDIAMTLIKTGTVSNTDFIGSQRYTFANGSSAESNVFKMHEIKIGNRVVKNVRVSISNSINAPMLLGQSFMQRIGKFTVDNVNHTLTIE